MEIATGSVNIDENAKLASDLADKNSRKFQTFMEGKINRSTKSPSEAGDTNPHQDGDMWVKVDDDGNSTDMWIWGSGKWQVTTWDAQLLKVKTLDSLTGNLGTVNSGTINGVKINGGEINVDIRGDSGAHDSGHNWLTWDSPNFVTENPELGDYYGFHFRNGLMSFKGFRTGSKDGTGLQSTDSLYIGPNDLKLRNTKYADAGSVNNRVDIRSNYIEIGDDFYPPSTEGNNGCGIYPDGTAVVSKKLYTNELDATSINTNYGGNSTGSNFWVTPNGWINGKGVTVDGLTVTGNVNMPNFKPSQNSYFPFLQADSASIAGINNHSDAWCISGSWFNGGGIDVGGVKYNYLSQQSVVSAKTNIEKTDNREALRAILSTDLYKYKYKNDNSKFFYGPIIDNINEEKDVQYKTSNKLLSLSENGEKFGFSLNNTVGMLIGSVHELSKQNEQLLAKITKMEIENYGKN